MSTTDKALRVVRDGKPFAFTDGGFAFQGFRIKHEREDEIVVPYFRQTLYVVGFRVFGRWSSAADAVPTALRRRSSGRVQYKG